jgi:hypothetical protein
MKTSLRRIVVEVALLTTLTGGPAGAAGARGPCGFAEPLIFSSPHTHSPQSISPVSLLNTNLPRPPLSRKLATRPLWVPPLKRTSPLVLS